MLNIKSPESCRFDIVSLGEVMLRLDPGERRIRTARNFNVWEGGGEYNVSRGLRRCFNQRAAIVTALARNEVGLLLEDLILQGGVSTDLIQWVNTDGGLHSARNGLNFTERGFGIRSVVGCSDRGNSATSKLKAQDIDWEYIFGELGVRWFHTGGIFAALSDSTFEIAVEAARVARKYGTIVSYDLNYRHSLWNGPNGVANCQRVNREIAQYVDVIIGNEGHFDVCLGLNLDKVNEETNCLDSVGFDRLTDQATTEFPAFKVIATTLRNVHSASVNDWGARCWADGQVHMARNWQGLQILDRVGGGDGFASGLIYGLMEYKDPARAIEYGAAHGALSMTTPGDSSMVSLSEVETLVARASSNGAANRELR